jgi:hypothetical protein
MTYTPPPLSDLRASVSRDLRDPTNKTFTTGEVDDLIRMGIVEVSRVYPKERVLELLVTEDGQRTFDVLDAYSLFRVELLDIEGNTRMGIPASVDNVHSETGWDFHAEKLYLPAYASVRLAVVDEPKVRAWGYWKRDVLTDDTDVFDGDADAEYASRSYALMVGYQRLQNDRLLFQQWLTTTGNTDVSPNQLAQTADMYQGEWRAYRQRLRIGQRQ